MKYIVKSRLTYPSADGPRVRFYKPNASSSPEMPGFFTKTTSRVFLFFQETTNSAPSKWGRDGRWRSRTKSLGGWVVEKTGVPRALSKSLLYSSRSDPSTDFFGLSERLVVIKKTHFTINVANVTWQSCHIFLSVLNLYVHAGRFYAVERLQVRSGRKEVLWKLAMWLHEQR